MDAKKYLLRQLSSVVPFTMILLSSVFILLNVSGCDDDEPPPPSGSVKVFLTSAAYDGNFAGAPVTFTPAIDGADAACTTAATNAGQTGTWTAWLSDNSTAAVDRVFSNGTPYVLLDGTVIANNLADLVDGTLVNPILIDESGNTVNGAFEVWTATAADGTKAGVGSCLNWTTADAGETGLIGRADAVDATWTDVKFEDTCDTFNRLYCFAKVISN